MPFSRTSMAWPLLLCGLVPAQQPVAGKSRIPDGSSVYLEAANDFVRCLELRSPAEIQLPDWPENGDPRSLLVLPSWKRSVEGTDSAQELFAAASRFGRCVFALDPTTQHLACDAVHSAFEGLVHAVAVRGWHAVAQGRSRDAMQAGDVLFAASRHFATQSSIEAQELATTMETRGLALLLAASDGPMVREDCRRVLKLLEAHLQLRPGLRGTAGALRRAVLRNLDRALPMPRAHAAANGSTDPAVDVAAVQQSATRWIGRWFAPLEVEDADQDPRILEKAAEACAETCRDATAAREVRLSDLTDEKRVEWLASSVALQLVPALDAFVEREKRAREELKAAKLRFAKLAADAKPEGR